MISKGQNQVSFCTPVIKDDSCMMNAIEGYTWFGGKTANVIYTGQKKSLAVEKIETSSWIVTAFKIATMILTLGLFPLIALAIKAISRCSSKVYGIPSKNMMDSDEVRQLLATERSLKPRVSL